MYSTTATSLVQNITAVAGSVVNFSCELDAKCVNRSVRWMYYSATNNEPVMWSNGRSVHSSLNSSGVTVEYSRPHGWSVLTIPHLRIADRGMFQCFVTDIQLCQMNFQLTVIGKYYSLHLGYNEVMLWPRFVCLLVCLSTGLLKQLWTNFHNFLEVVSSKCGH